MTEEQRQVIFQMLCTLRNAQKEINTMLNACIPYPFDNRPKQAIEKEIISAIKRGTELFAD